LKQVYTMMHGQKNIKNKTSNPTNGLTADVRSQTKRQTNKHTNKQTNIRILSLYNALILVLKEGLKTNA